jgi:DNA-binding LacI/PurR family transcriptional regulator
MPATTTMKRRARDRKSGSARVTSVDVARTAGVSQSAVSRVFTPGASVSATTRRKVMAAATDLGYRPNALARSLITQRSHLIGIVMAHLTNPFYPPVLDTFSRKLQAQGRGVLLISAPRTGDIDAALPEVLQYQVDAIVITSATLSSAMAEECARQGRPVVLFNRVVADAKVHAVCCDNVAGGRRVADLFLDAGDTRTGYVAGTENSSTNLERERGFRERLRARGAPLPLRAVGNYNYADGAEAARQLLNRKDRPTAMFCANDVMACAAIDVARARGLRVPEDLSVVAFDDSIVACLEAYQLTTIRQPVEAMVDKTIELILAPGAGSHSKPVVCRLPGELVVRGSARLPPGMAR